MSEVVRQLPYVYFAGLCWRYYKKLVGEKKINNSSSRKEGE